MIGLVENLKVYSSRSFIFLIVLSTNKSFLLKFFVLNGKKNLDLLNFGEDQIKTSFDM